MVKDCLEAGHWTSEMERKSAKTDDKKKSLVWEFRRSLFTLSADELFQIAKTLPLFQGETSQSSAPQTLRVALST
ncbi:hypothetical protein AOLI_G00202680 [Acnodon oligacanthus]